MGRITKFLLLAFSCLISFGIASAQTDFPADFEFDYTWGTYGHFKVSSGKGRVYIKVQHPATYADTTIEFSAEDRQRIWEQAQKISFFDYPAEYAPRVPVEEDTLPEYELHTLIFEDSIQTDTFWLEKPIIYYSVGERIPHSTQKLDFYWEGRHHSVSWDGGKTLTRHGADGKEEVIKDPQYEQLFSLGNLIVEIVREKQGFKNLPESDLIYY